MDNRALHTNAQPRIWTRQFFWLTFLALSYLYCLPLLRTGVLLGITASEVRLYDIVFICILFLFLLPKFSQFIGSWRRLSKAHKYLFYWVIVAFVGLLILGIFRSDRFLIGLIRYIRFFSYCSVFILIYIFIDNRKQLQIFFNLLLTGIIAVSVIGTLQSLNIVPNLWPDYYSVYWEYTTGYLSTSTLAPNHTHYSLIMSIGIIMVLTVLKIDFRLHTKNLFFIAGLIPMTYSMIASQGRSGWLVLMVYLIYTVLFSRGKIVTIALVFGAILFVLNYLSAVSEKSSIQDILLYRSINAHKDLGRTSLDIFEEGDKNYIQRIDDNRWFIYQTAISHLSERPEYWFLGAGFQNASRAIGGVSIAAHNAYLNVFAEHGIVGLFVYMAFLYHLFMLGWKLRKTANSKESYYFANEWIGLFLGILAANFFGEIIYPGRALFTFLGTFFVICGLFLHPAWRAPKVDDKN